MQKLSELIETYPSSYTKGIQTLITAKKELAELSSSSSEKAPEFGSFFKHQLLTHRVLRFLDDFLVISETGTGKSAEILGFTESALNAYDNERSGIEYDDRLSHFGRIMIFAGELQEEDIKNQLINKIARKYLEVKDISDAKNEKMRRAGVKRVLKRAGYQIHQYRSFCNSIRRDYPETAEGDRRMAEDFSDTIFWIDEVHNITGSEDQNSDKGDDNVSDDATIYETFWRIFHTAKRCKKIISTATPMINSEEELKSILNLILPKNGEIPIELDYTNLDKIEMKTWFPEIPENTDMTQISREDAQIYFRGQIPKDFRVSSAKINEIEPYLRGRIGYIRALDTGATPVYHGECLHIPMIDSITGKHYESKVVTVNSFMSEHQAAGYIKMSAKNDFYQSSRQASNIVFPDGETSSTEYDKAKGFKAYVTKRNNKYYMNSELRRHFSTIEGIRNLSCKYATIVENILKNHGNTFHLFPVCRAF